MCVLWNEKEERFVHVVSRENFAFIVDWLQNHWLHPDSDMVIMSADFGKYLSKLKKNSPQCNIFKKSTQSFPENSPWWILAKWIDRTMDFQKSNLVGGNSPGGIHQEGIVRTRPTGKYANWFFKDLVSAHKIGVSKSGWTCCPLFSGVVLESFSILTLVKEGYWRLNWGRPSENQQVSW